MRKSVCFRLDGLLHFRLATAAKGCWRYLAARGKVKWFSEEKGYGFIKEEDFFVHYTEIVGGGFRRFEEGRRGRKQAAKVEVVG